MVRFLVYPLEHIEYLNCGKTTNQGQATMSKGKDVMKMKKVIAIVCLCSIWFVAGCASVEMRPAPAMAEPTENEVVVNFVRPRIWLGDGIHVDLWDGEAFIGTLKAGTKIQYRTEPGNHVFLANAENWAYLVGELEGGKEYYFKANVFPGVMTARVALGVAYPGDKRVREWEEGFQSVMPIEEDRVRVEAENATDVRKALDKYEAGEVSFGEITAEHGHSTTVSIPTTAETAPPKSVSETSQEAVSGPAVDDDEESLRKLKNLYEQGLINEEEYAAEKKEILDKF